MECKALVPARSAGEARRREAERAVDLGRVADVGPDAVPAGLDAEAGAGVELGGEVPGPGGGGPPPRDVRRAPDLLEPAHHRTGDDLRVGHEVQPSGDPLAGPDALGPAAGTGHPDLPRPRPPCPAPPPTRGRRRHRAPRPPRAASAAATGGRGPGPRAPAPGRRAARPHRTDDW